MVVDTDKKLEGDSDNAAALRFLEAKIPDDDLDPVVRDCKRTVYAFASNVVSEDLMPNQALKDQVLTTASSVIAALPPAQPSNSTKPAWFSEFEQNIDGKFSEFHGKFNEVQASMAELQKSNKVIQTQIANMESRLCNKEHIHLQQDYKPFHPILKLVEGNGDGLPECPLLTLHYRKEPPEAVLAIGDAPRAFFPENKHALDRMSDSDLNILSVLYNDKFDITEADDIVARRIKFLYYISYH